MAKTPTWQRAAGKNPEGGLNEAGRRSLRAAGHDIKRPQPEGGPRKKSFCARMKGMKAQNTSAETANDPNSRINKSLRKWKCADGGEVTVDNALRMARGRPDEGGQERFLREQLAGSAPQYEPSKDFPARAERAVQAADRYAGMLNDLAAKGAGLPSQFQSPQGRSAREIVESALPQDPNAIVKQAMRQAGEGNRLAAAETMLGGIPETGAIRAYHGSPYLFDRFDISKIGTGEGAQAYGHGLYFAENEGVARSYRDILSPYKIDNVPANEISGARAKTADDAFLASVLAHEKTPQNARFKLDRLNRLDLMEKLDELVAQNRVTPGGHMYEVEIAAEPHQLLDWDKPLSEQPEAVREALHRSNLIDFEKNIGPSSTGEIKNLGWSQNVPSLLGEKFYRRLTEGKYTPEMFAKSIPRSEAQAQATKIIREAGIPGIQYLDAGSRGYQVQLNYKGNPYREPLKFDNEISARNWAQEQKEKGFGADITQEGTRNFVIFDPSLIDIKRRYAEGGDVTVDNALRMARNMGGGTLYNQLNYALNSPTPANPPQDPGPQQPYYQSLAQTRDIVQQYGTPAPGAPTSSAVRQPMPYADGGEVQQMVEEFKSPHSEQNLGMMSALPIDNSQKLDVGEYQRSMAGEDPNKLLRAADTESTTQFYKNYYEQNPHGKKLTYQETIKYLPYVAMDSPQNVIQATPTQGHSTVIDPEGRVGHPLYVAGTTPEGKNVSLTPGQSMDLANKISRLYSYSNPSATEAGHTLFSPDVQKKLPFGLSSSSIGVNVSSKTPQAQTVAHETGHAIHNYLGRGEIPLKGVPKQAMNEMLNEAQNRWKSSYKSEPELKTYTIKPQEMFAESIRGYIQDPAYFKGTSPATARWLRGIINTDPRINKLLNLSRIEQNQQVAAKGGAIWNKPRPKSLGKSEPLSPSQKASAKAMAKAAGRPYPNMVDNLRAARKADGGQVEGDVQFAPNDLPMMARQPDVEIENALRMARGRPDEASQQRFLKEQLAGSAPQYDPEAGLRTAKEAGQMIAGMTTPGAIADIGGYLGGPSLRENIREGNYGTAAMQVAGAFPGIGPLAKAAKIAEEAKALKSVAPATRVEFPKPDPALLTVHNVRSHRLPMAERLGGAPVPSIAIINPEHGFSSFGDISLVGSPEMARPSRLNPVFASDVYSPRFPSIEDDGERIFRGFTPSGYRRYAPLTMENVVREMKGNIRGGEGGSGLYGAGFLRSQVTPQFKSLESIQRSRGKIIPKEEFSSIKDEANEKLIDLADRTREYSKYRGTPNDLITTLTDVARGRHGAWAQDFNDLPQNFKDEAIDYLKYLRNLPTEYFEAKPQRAVGYGEFEGAVVPQGILEEVSPALKRLGTKEIIPYNPEESGAQQRAFELFKPHFFADGGEVVN